MPTGRLADTLRCPRFRSRPTPQRLKRSDEVDLGYSIAVESPPYADPVGVGEAE